MSVHKSRYGDNSNKPDGYQDVMSNTELKYSRGSTDYEKSSYGLHTNNELHSQYDNSPLYGPISSHSQDDTKSSISFSNSLLNPKAFMKRIQINKEFQPLIPMHSPTYSGDDTSAATFSSISNLLQNVL